MAENQLLDAFYQMMLPSMGNAQSCNNTATDLISLQRGIYSSFILQASFFYFALILSLFTANLTIGEVVSFFSRTVTALNIAVF